MARKQAPPAPGPSAAAREAPGGRRPRRRRPDTVRIALTDDERAEVYAARAVLLGPKGGLRDLLLVLVRGEGHEYADKRRIADLASALGATRAVTADIRDLAAAVRDLEQRMARLPLEAPAAAREHAGELRDALFAAEHTLAAIDRARAAIERDAAPTLEVVSSAVRGILAAHAEALNGAMGER